MENPLSRDLENAPDPALSKESKLYVCICQRQYRWEKNTSHVTPVFTQSTAIIIFCSIQVEARLPKHSSQRIFHTHPTTHFRLSPRTIFGQTEAPLQISTRPSSFWILTCGSYFWISIVATPLPTIHMGTKCSGDTLQIWATRQRPMPSILECQISSPALIRAFRHPCPLLRR